MKILGVFLAIGFLYISSFANIVTKKFIDVDNTLINRLNPLLESSKFNNYPDDYGEVFVDVNGNGVYDKKTSISIYSKEKDLSDGILDGREQGLLANLIVEVDEFCPRNSLEKYLELANSSNILFSNGIIITTSVSNHFIDSQLLTWDPKEDKSYNGDFSLKYMETVDGKITVSDPVYSDNVLTYLPKNVKYSASGKEYFVTAEIDTYGRFYVKNNDVNVYVVSEPCLTSEIITSKEDTLTVGTPPSSGSGGGCLMISP